MNKELIEKYLHQRCSSEEKTAVEQWIETNGAQWFDDYFDQHIHNETQFDGLLDDDVMFMQVLTLIREKQAGQQKQDIATVIHMRTEGRKRYWWIAAACLVLLAGIGWFGMQQARKSSAVSTQFAWTEIGNPDLTIKQIKLPDGSQVALNKGSVIRYQQLFGQNEREVELSGEAYFDVTRDSKRPFTVKSGEAATVVYGTSFNIHAYPEEGQMSVALRAGKIGVRYSGKMTDAVEKILAPGEMFQLNKSSGEVSLSKIPADQVGSWRTGGLSFYNTPMHDVFMQMERKYNVHFRVAENTQTDNTFTAYFPEVSLDRVLQHLQFTSGLQFSRKDSIIYVK